MTKLPLAQTGTTTMTALSSELVDRTAGARARVLPFRPANGHADAQDLEIILSFDVEEHDRIEAAAGLTIDPALKAHCARRLEPATRWLLDALAAEGIRATFFIVGEIARQQPGLVRAIHQAGHEVASHSWDHRRVHLHTPQSFRDDVTRSQDALAQVTGEAVVGYRAPTFSVMRQTAWAVDVLAELGMLYDSSIYPVHHDRYGVPAAPRAPFLVQGERQHLLEIPPATLRVLGTNVPMGGGGYFRLFPVAWLESALRQVRHDCRPAVAMLYFHPWESDPHQARLPLRFLSRLRTYAGVFRSRARFRGLLRAHRFVRAVDVARRLGAVADRLPTFSLLA